MQETTVSQFQGLAQVDDDEGERKKKKKITRSTKRRRKNMNRTSSFPNNACPFVFYSLFLLPHCLLEREEQEHLFPTDTH